MSTTYCVMFSAAKAKWHRQAGGFNNNNNNKKPFSQNSEG